MDCACKSKKGRVGVKQKKQFVSNTWTNVPGLRDLLAAGFIVIDQLLYCNAIGPLYHPLFWLSGEKQCLLL